MTRKLLLLLTVALASVATASVATAATTNAATTCTTLRAKIGVTSFAHTFASVGACTTLLAPLARSHSNAAVTICRSEQASTSFAAAHNGKTFAAFYGTFGRCVSAHTSQAWAKDVSAGVSCSAQQANANFAASHNGKTFAEFYGASPFRSCILLTGQPLVVADAQPAQSQPTQGTTKSSCGSGTGAGPNHPLVTNCAVATTN